MSPQANKAPEDIIAEQCLARRLRLLNRVVTGVYDDALRPLGLKISQLNILVAAAKAGIARPAVICDRLHLNTSTLSRNVERMKAKGWVEVVGDEDGRAQPFRLTTKGRALLERAKPGWDAAQKQIKQRLGKETVQSLIEAISSLQPTHLSR